MRLGAGGKHHPPLPPKKKTPNNPKPKQNKTPALREGSSSRGRGGGGGEEAPHGNTRRVGQPPAPSSDRRSAHSPPPLGERLLTVPYPRRRPGGGRGDPPDTGGEERGGPGGPRRRRGLWGRRGYCPRGGDWAAQVRSCTPSPPPHRVSTHLSHPRCPCRSSASGAGWGGMGVWRVGVGGRARPPHENRPPLRAAAAIFKRLLRATPVPAGGTPRSPSQLRSQPLLSRI